MTQILFFGTPKYVIPILEELKKAGYEISAVITQSPKPAGRQQILTPSPVEQWALTNKISVFNPEKLDEDFVSRLTSHVSRINVGILAAYGKIIPQEIIDLFPKGILAIHPSLLPAWRGASPVQAAIATGDKITGVTIIQMDAKMDHGPIVAQFKEEIQATDTSEILYPRLFKAAAKVLMTILPDYLKGKIRPREQDHSKATYSKILKREDGFIDLRHLPSPEMFEQLTRAYHPWPGTWTESKIKNQKLRIKFLPPPKIQVGGGKPMTVKDFLNSYPETKEWLAKIYPSTLNL